MSKQKLHLIHTIKGEEKAWCGRISWPSGVREFVITPDNKYTFCQSCVREFSKGFKEPPYNVSVMASSLNHYARVMAPSNSSSH